MRQFIDILNEAAADYKVMINPVLAALNAPQGNGVTDNIHGGVAEKIQKLWNDEMNAAKKNLGKADAITWYLRMVRAAIIQKYLKVLDPAKINKVIQDYNTKVGVPIERDGFRMADGYGDSILELTHFLSLPIQGIKNYQFRFQPYNEVKGDFQQMEDKWKETVKDSIEDNDSKVIIDCGGGWYWVDTEKAYCSKEASAMGHCGNEPRKNSGDHLLSLRKKLMVGNETRWQPHLTFILAPDGYLTEMKGRNNDKPVAKYHPMIIKLLMSDYVTGIRGGGYLPEHNFSMNDLDEEQRDEMVAEKPELGNTLDLFNKLGVCDEVFNRLVNDLNEYGLEIDSYDGDTILIEKWNDMNSFFRGGVYDDNWEKVANMADGDFDGWMMETDDAKIIDDIMETDAATESDFAGALAHKVGTRPDDAAKGLIHMFPNSLKAVWQEVRTDIKNEALVACKAKIEGFRIRCYDLSLSVEEDGSVRLTCDFHAMVHNVVSYQNDDYDSTDGFEYVAQDRDWLSVDEYEDDYGDRDADEDATPMDADQLYQKADELAIQHINGLFHDDAQMDFGF